MERGRLMVSDQAPIRVQLYIRAVYTRTDGTLSDTPLAFVQLDNPATANADIAAVLRKLADEFEVPE